MLFFHLWDKVGGFLVLFYWCVLVFFVLFYFCILIILSFSTFWTYIPIKNITKRIHVCFGFFCLFLLALLDAPYFQNNHVAEIWGCRTRWIEQKTIIRMNNVALIILCCHNTICVAPDQSNFDMTNKPLRENGDSINCPTVWPNTIDISSPKSVPQLRHKHNCQAT